MLGKVVGEVASSEIEPRRDGASVAGTWGRCNRGCRSWSSANIEGVCGGTPMMRSGRRSYAVVHHNDVL